MHPLLKSLVYNKDMTIHEHDHISTLPYKDMTKGGRDHIRTRHNKDIAI